MEDNPPEQTKITVDSPQLEFYVRWRIRDIFSVLGLMLILPIGIGLFVGVIVGLVGAFIHPGGFSKDIIFKILQKPLFLDLQTLLSLLTTFFILWALIFKRYKVNYLSFFRFENISKDISIAMKAFGWGVLGSMLLAMIIIMLVALVGFLLGDSEKWIQWYAEGSAAEGERVLKSVSSWLRVPVMVILAPTIEEFLFRGCLYGSLRKRWSPWKANLVTTGVFTLMHFRVFNLPMLIFLGIITALVYEKTRSLFPGIVFHTLWNTLVLSFIHPPVFFLLVFFIVSLSIISRKAKFTPVS